VYVLAWIVAGAVVGWGAGRIFQGNGYGPLLDILMGVGGAIVCGFAMSSTVLGGYGGTIITILVAMVGAVLLTLCLALTSTAQGFMPGTSKCLRTRNVQGSQPTSAYAESQVEALKSFRQFCRRSTSQLTDACAVKLLGSSNVSH